MSSNIKRRPMASPLRYPGGKGALYVRLRALLRANGLAGCTYVEPYAGGAGAGLSLLVTGQVSKIIINDLDPAVFAFWKALTLDPDDFQRKIKSARLTVKEWQKQKAVFTARDETVPMQLGFATFYLNRTNRSGVLNGGPIGGLDQTGPYKIDARFNREALMERVRVIGLYANQITVSKQDGLAVIRRAVKRPNTFVYADPPYFEKAGSLYLNAFAAADHQKLASVLNQHPDANWLLTYDDHGQVDDLYADRRRRRFGLNYSAHRVTTATEVAVLSDSLADIADGWPS